MPRPPTATRGFTLVEVLVALALMALLSLMSWRGLESMLRTREVTRSRSDAVSLVQVSVSQWQADLNAVQAMPGLLRDAALGWNGKTLQMLRRSGSVSHGGEDAGLWVVAWTVRDGHWWRWQSPDLRDRAAVLQAWQEASQWGQNPSSESRRFEAQLMPMTSWQLFYYRDNAWVNPLSSVGNAADAKTANQQLQEAGLPDAVRIQFNMDSGSMTLDWVNPGYNPSRS